MTNEQALEYLGCDAQEQEAFTRYRTARQAYDHNPSVVTASQVLQTAQVLADISDDYQSLLDEADDIMAEPV